MQRIIVETNHEENAMIKIYNKDDKRHLELTRENVIDALMDNLNDARKDNSKNILKILESMSDEQLQEIATDVLSIKE